MPSFPQPNSRTWRIIGLICRADDQSVKLKEVPINPHTQLPILRAILGPGLFCYDVVPCHAADGQVRFFLIAWKFRRDRRANQHLLRIYPHRRFALDMVAVMIRPSGEFMPLLGSLNKLRASCAIRDILSRLHSSNHT